MPKKRRKPSKQVQSLVSLLAIALILIALFLLIYGKITEQPRPKSLDSGLRLELCAPVEDEIILEKEGFLISYNPWHKVANYCAYQLTGDETQGPVERVDSFKPDERVVNGPELKDYKGSGYDRGHLVPAADQKWSELAMSDSFYLTNMTPQDASFNRGIWADLEAEVRDQAYKDGSLYIATGPILTDGPYETIGEDVAVPKRFFKALLDYTEPTLKAIVFLLPNEGSSGPLSRFAISIDELEEISGMDFFYQLDDEIESKLESSCDISLWWKII